MAVGYPASGTMVAHAMVTTQFELDGFRVVRTLGVVRGIVVRSRSIFGTIGASLQTILGGNITLLTNLCEKTRAEAFDLMLQHAAELGGDPARIAVAGDSAGGNISAVMAQLARDDGGPALVFQLLWYPSTTGDLTLPSMIENADGPILDRDVVAAFLQWYLPPDIDTSEPAKLPPTLSPANTADLSGLPPAFIGTAEYDPVRDDGARYAELLSAAGVPVQHYNAPTLVHGFVSFALVVPAAAEATSRGLAALKAALNRG